MYEKNETVEMFRREVERLEVQRAKDRQEQEKRSSSSRPQVSRSTSPIKQHYQSPTSRTLFTSSTSGPRMFQPDNNVSWEEVYDTVPPVMDETNMRQSRVSVGRRTPGGGDSFNEVRRDLQDVIQSHFDRIENLTEELNRTAV